MHRNLFKAARDFCNTQKLRKRGWKIGVDGTHSSHAFSGSHDFNNYHLGDNVGTRFVQLQVVNSLRKGDRQQASKMLLNLGEVNDHLGAEDFTCILEFCARTLDPLFAMETWKIMEGNGIGMNKRSCRLILQAFSKGGYFKEALNWLNFLGENDGMHTALPMFNIFLSGCWSSKSLNFVDHCLELMENQLVGKSEVTYWQLLKLAVLQRNLSAVHEIWKEYTKYYSPSVIMLRKFVRSFSKLGDLESANAALKHLLVLARQGSALLSVSATRKYQSSALDIPIPARDESYEKRFLLGNLTSLMFEGNTDRSVDPMGASMDISIMRRYNAIKNFELETSESQSHSNTIDALLSETIRSILLNELEKGRSIPEAHAIFSGAVRNNSSNFQVKQEDFYELSPEKTKQGSEMASDPLMNLLRWSFNDMIHACTQSNNYHMAEQLFLQMLDIGLEPSKHTYDGFVKAAVTGKGVAYGMKVVKIMQERNIEPYNDTFAVLSIGHSRNLDLDMAESFSDKISHNLPKYIHTFNALLSACGIMDEPERAVRILAKIKRLKMKLNIRTYELMFSLFGTVNVPYEKGNILSHVDVARRIRAIEMDMMKNGIQHSYASIKNLIRALGAEGMIEEMLQYLNVAENLLCQTDAYQRTDVYNIVLYTLVKTKENHKAIEVFRSMRSCSLPADISTYNIMIECCSKLTCQQSACAIISLMLRDGFYPQIVTFTALIKVLLANEDFEGALSLLDQLRSEGIQLDIQLFNTILREAYTKMRIDVIELIIERMHREKIRPDPSTLWYTFSAYVESDFHNTAMEALQVLTMRMISEGEEILQEKRAVFEELILSEDPDVEIEIINETFKDSQEFLATALMNLRWCAIMGSAISWSPEESQWAKRLASKVST